MFELDDLDGDVRAHVKTLELSSRRLFSDQVSIAMEAGAFRADLDVEQFVWDLSGVYLGHHVSSRFMDDPNATPRALSAFERLIDHAQAGPNLQA